MINTTKNRTFNISKSSRIFLYGDNVIASFQYSKLKKRHYNVAGIIDRKFGIAGNINDTIGNYGDKGFFKGDADKFILEYGTDTNAVVMICLNDGVSHEDVATSLAEKGFNRIVFIPMGNGLSFEDAEKMRRVYFDFREGNFSKLKRIPKYIKTDFEFPIIRETKTHIFFYCPFKYLHLPGEEFFNEQFKTRRPDARELFRAYQLNPLTQFIPWIKLFKYLLNQLDEYPEEYLNMQFPDWKTKFADLTNKYGENILLSNRKRLLTFFEYHYKFDKAFFAYSASETYMDKKSGVPCVADGLHRVCYLYCKGDEFVPIRLLKKEVDAFLKFVGEQK